MPQNPDLLNSFQNSTVVAVVGLGYVGLPLALAFGRTSLPTYGFDISTQRIDQLKQGNDSTNEVSPEDMQSSTVQFTADGQDLKQANFIIVAVPTPVDEQNQPDLTIVEKASELIGRNLKPGAIVVYESTVYPGATEDICVPILEASSGLKNGKDFTVGYSPERINPGDKEHTLERVVKIVSGQDEPTTAKIAAVYETVCGAGVYIAADIKTAEAAKVIENTQRDLNIALMNELSIIFHRMGIDTQGVLDAAGTKWNFHHYKPGLVGGHCIGVDPYYLVYQSKVMGYEPKLISAARAINDGMDAYVTEAVLEQLTKMGKEPKDAHLLVMGLTFKPDVKDVRNARIGHVIKLLKEKGVTLSGYDPLLSASEITAGFNITPTQDLNSTYDGIIIAAPHKAFQQQSEQLVGRLTKDTFIVDVTGMLKSNVHDKQASYWSL